MAWRIITNQVLLQLQGFCSEMALTCEALQSGLNDFENAFALMQGGVARPDTQEVRDDIAALREAAMAMETTIGKAMEEIDISGAVTPATKAQLIADLKTVLNCYAVTVRDTVSLIINTNFSALREQNLETAAADHRVSAKRHGFFFLCCGAFRQRYDTIGRCHRDAACYQCADG